MYEFKINFGRCGAYGQNVTVWRWNQSDYVTVLDKIYLGNRAWILKTIKDEIRRRFGCKRAIWEIRS